MVDCEIIARKNQHLATLLREATPKWPACIEDIDYTHSRGLDRAVMEELRSYGSETRADRYGTEVNLPRLLLFRGDDPARPRPPHPLHCNSGSAIVWLSLTALL